MTTPACSVFLEDFNGITTVPCALLNDQWMCRKCGRLAADHPHRPQQQKQQFFAPTRESPGSKSNPSRNAPQGLVETIEQTGFDVNWCGSGTNWKDKVLSRSTKKTQEITNLLNFREASEEILSGNANELDGLDFRLIGQESETTFQKGHLQTHFFNVEAANALDLSDATTDGPFFKPATRIVSGEVVSAKSGKPDGTSKMVPMDLEIKSDKTADEQLIAIDYEVLEQAVERVSMRMHNQGFLI